MIEHLGTDYISKSYEETLNVLATEFDEIIKICKDNLKMEEEEKETISRDKFEKLHQCFKKMVTMQKIT